MIDKEEARARLITMAQNESLGLEREALIIGANALVDNENLWLEAHDKRIRAEAIYEAIQIADCSHTDCWDCAFGEADICKLEQLYGQLKEQNKW